MFYRLWQLNIVEFYAVLNMSRLAKCLENDDKVIIPDVSIICNMRDRKNISFTGISRFVMEVLPDATEDYDRNEKMDIYRIADLFICFA